MRSKLFLAILLLTPLLVLLVSTLSFQSGYSPKYTKNNGIFFNEYFDATQLDLVDDIENLDLSIIENNTKIGITASASSPEILVKKILNKIEESFELNIIESRYEKEDTHFKIPQKLKEAV